jgi:hypothetical protein
MTPPFLCLLAAACILRYLSSDAMKQFKLRLAALLPRNVMEDHLRVLLGEFPDRLTDFRRRVLPCSVLHLIYNAAAAACFVGALWYFPPREMQHWDLIFVRYGSVVLTPLAFMADVVIFARMLVATSGRGGQADGAV